MSLIVSRVLTVFCIAVFAALTAGCGTTRERQATEQLVLSDAVDQSIAALDFRPLTGRKVYFDTSYLRPVKEAGFVNSEYIISGIRQQIVSAGCLIQDSSKDADVVIEARIGALGADENRVTFGIPETNTLSSAASVLPNAPSIPAIPEIAFARRDARDGAAKLAAFAYDRETRQPIWQSGMKESMATARDTWVFGVGPFQAGTVREGTKLAGSEITFGSDDDATAADRMFNRPRVDYTAEVRFDSGWPLRHKGFVPGMIELPPGERPQTEALVDKSDGNKDGKKDESVNIAEAPTDTKKH